MGDSNSGLGRTVTFYGDVTTIYDVEDKQKEKDGSEPQTPDSNSKTSFKFKAKKF